MEVILWCPAAKRRKAREEWIGWEPRTRGTTETGRAICPFCLLREQLSRKPGVGRVGTAPAGVVASETWLQTAAIGDLHRPGVLRGRLLPPGGRDGGGRHQWSPPGRPRLLSSRRGAEEPVAQSAAPGRRGPGARAGRVGAARMRRGASGRRDGRVADKLAQAESLHDVFACVPDPRAGNRHHRPATVLTLVALSILMGRQRPADFVRLARQLNARQREALGRRTGMPAWRRPAAMCSTRCSAGRARGARRRMERGDTKPARPAPRRAGPGRQGRYQPGSRRSSAGAGNRRQRRGRPSVRRRKRTRRALRPPAARKNELAGALVSLDAGHANHETARTIVAAGRISS